MADHLQSLSSPAANDYDYKRGVEDFRSERDAMKRDSPQAAKESHGTEDRPRADRRERDSARFAPYNRERRPAGGRRPVAGKDCRVYVKNLPYELRWQELKDIMRKAGDVQFVEIIHDKDGNSKGCGVVEYATAEDAARSIRELEDFEIQGRKIKLREDRVPDDEYERQLSYQKERENRSHSSSYAPPSHHQAPPNPSGGIGSSGIGALSFMSMLNSKNMDPINCTVFVSNLDYKLSWQRLKDGFRKAGNVVRADIAEDNDRVSKGFGTVVFETPMEALNAVVLCNGQALMDRPIQVRVDRNSALCQMLSALGVSSSGINQVVLLQLQSLAAISSLTQAGGSTGGLGALTGLTALGGLGSLGGLGALGGLGGLGGLGAIAGLGGLANAGNSNNGNVSGLGSGVPSSGIGGLGLAGLTSLLGGSGGLGSIGNMGNSQSSSGGGSVGRSSDFSRGGGSNSRESHSRQVFVRNLPWKTTWQDLKDKFREAGRVVRADVFMDDKMRSKGCATVMFEASEDADRAVSMFNGARIDGREIDVRLDRE